MLGASKTRNYNCSSIPSVNTSVHHYTFLESELKGTQKQFAKNIWTWKYSFMHLPIESCSSTINSLIIIGNFRKHSTLIHIKAYVLLLFFIYYLVIPVYFNEFIYEMVKWNRAKIKNYNYEVLNLQEYVTMFAITHENL